MMGGMKTVNLNATEPRYDSDDPPGYHAGYARLGPLLGATKLGATIYELPPGQSNCPYHYEYGCEEWLLVLEGEVTVRHPEGESVLRPGDVACFPEGAEGAHKLSNLGDATVRLVMLSTKGDPGVAVYPDSDKIGVWPGDDRDTIMVRRASNVSYWDGETEETRPGLDDEVGPANPS
jgi:uncharacterized cupin superfamily protein